MLNCARASSLPSSNCWETLLALRGIGERDIAAIPGHVTNVGRADAAVQAAYRVLAFAGAQLSLGRGRLDKRVELYGGPVLDEDQEKGAHHVLAHASEVGNVVEHHAATKYAQRAKYEQSL